MKRISDEVARAIRQGWCHSDKIGVRYARRLGHDVRGGEEACSLCGPGGVPVQEQEEVALPSPRTPAEDAKLGPKRKKWRGM
jgi:hypothetical protein